MLFWKVQTLHTTKCLSVSHLRSSADRSRTHFQHAFYKRWLTYLQHFRRWAFCPTLLVPNRGKGSKYGINSRGKLRRILILQMAFILRRCAQVVWRHYIAGLIFETITNIQFPSHRFCKHRSLASSTRIHFHKKSTGKGFFKWAEGALPKRLIKSAQYDICRSVQELL